MLEWSFSKMELIDSCSAKYTLRTKSILKRIESERTRHTNSKKRENKEKEKPPPLSKYRRKTANARERNRMKEINDAFISLQSSLPDIPGTDADKLTKITVLKLAVTYIGALAKVLDTNSALPMDVEDVRQMWCMDNAHITKTDNCSKTFNKNSPARKDSQNKLGLVKPLTTASRAQSSAPRKRHPSNQAGKLDNQKDKFLHSTIKPAVKKPGKSRSRGKVCRTNSVATNNGAYITLKNCAMQTTHNPKSRQINNQPLMMSMTVKRTRMEPIVGHRSTKMRKYEPLLTYSTPDLTQFNTITQKIPGINFSQGQQLCNGLQIQTPPNYTVKSSFTPQYNILPLQHIDPSKNFPFHRTCTPNNVNIQQIKHNYSAIPNSFQTVHQSLVSNDQKSYFTQSSPTELPQYLPAQTTTDCVTLGGLSFQDLDSPPVRNDVLLEFPQDTKLPSSADSAFSSGESAPSSPSLSLPPNTPTFGDISPFSSLTSLSGGSTSGCSISSTDCDSVFNSLLDCEPFQDELDHFTAAFTEESNSFNLFMDQASSTFINCNVDA
ncbi:uncharacterized protein LOC108682142 [Hyalella azteca]|uniref:Uncharacterized protein LOC108682142 n=1 Tax=Hyalella azteca TaxID=294128 RepID=A0A8B7PKN9_HYAAZ|nr:uncharacterized protein LOC108682142 [Hyalella azteca]